MRSLPLAPSARASSPPAFVLPSLAAKRLLQRDAELVARLPPVLPSAAVAEELAQVRLGPNLRTHARMHHGVGPAERRMRPTSEQDIDERPCITVPAHATGASEDLRHDAQFARARATGQVSDVQTRSAGARRHSAAACSASICSVECSM
jgi:hypothetical protein